jgi:hypothetical protein
MSRRAIRRFVASAGALFLLVASPAGGVICVGDCTAKGSTAIGDLQSCVNILLSTVPLAVCPNCDADGRGVVDIGEIQQTVNSILQPELCPTISAAMAVGSGAGVRSMKVTVPISLRTAGRDIVTVAPIEIDFDEAALALDSCESTVAGKLAYSASPEPGTVRLVLVDDVFGENGAPAEELAVFPTGPVADCTFDVLPAAPVGSTPLTFVLAAVADSEFNDIDLFGSNGAVTIQ